MGGIFVGDVGRGVSPTGAQTTETHEGGEKGIHVQLQRKSGEKPETGGGGQTQPAQKALSKEKTFFSNKKKKKKTSFVLVEHLF